MQIMHSTPLPERRSERAFAACIVDAVKRVATDLRNTPAVCRKSYINPVVFDAWRCGALHEAIGEGLRGAPRKAERLVAAFLRQQAASARREDAKRARSIPSGGPRRLRRNENASVARAAP